MQFVFLRLSQKFQRVDILLINYRLCVTLQEPCKSKRRKVGCRQIRRLVIHFFSNRNEMIEHGGFQQKNNTYLLFQVNIRN